MSQQQQLQLQLQPQILLDELTLTEVDVDELILSSRNADLRQLELDMTCINEIFKDLALLVGDQAELLDVAELQTLNASMNTEEGTENLQQAEVYSVQAKRRGWLFKGALAFSGITVGGLGLAIISPVIGLVTAGAGLTGIVGCIGIAIKKKKDKKKDKKQKELK